MNSAKGLFVLTCLLLFIIVPVFVKRRRLYFIGLASSLYIFSSGWIFYHFNGIMLADIPIFILIVMALASGRRIDLLVWPVGFTLLLFILWCLVCSITAIRPGWVVSETTKYIRMYFLVVGIANNIHGMRDLKAVIMGMFIGLLFESALGIYQWKFGSLGLWFLGERSASRISWRTMGTFFVPSFYANYLAMVLPVAFRLFVYFRAPSRKWSVFYGVTFLLGMVALFTTYGRGPWIGFSVSLAVVVLWSMLKKNFRSRVRYALPILIIFMSLFLYRYSGAIMNQFSNSRKASTEVRFPQFRIAWRVIKANPFTGVGLGNYDLNSWNYMTSDELRDPYARVYAMMVHNVYLFVAAESGLVGGSFLIIWLLSILFFSIRILRSKIMNDYIVNVTLGIFAGIMAIAIVFTFSPDIHAYQLLYQIGLYCGLLGGMQKLIRVAELKMRQGPERRRIRFRPGPSTALPEGPDRSGESPGFSG
ncbi:O-antigen ligase family protein [bacterium]|nr:O-antigen ligase family protein [bacterium]